MDSIQTAVNEVINFNRQILAAKKKVKKKSLLWLLCLYNKNKLQEP